MCILLLLIPKLSLRWIFLDSLTNKEIGSVFLFENCFSKSQMPKLGLNLDLPQSKELLG